VLHKHVGLQPRSSELPVLVLERSWVSKESVEKELEKMIGALAIARCMRMEGENELVSG
jgi:hypothetical protein